MDIEELIRKNISGSLIHEFVVCPRAAWFSYKRISMSNDLVELGKIIHENTYKREIKNVFEENIALDFIKSKNGEVWIYEVKKSSKMLDAARWQLLYYLYYLKKRGDVKAKGKIVVPKEKYNEILELSEEKESMLEEIVESLLNTVTSPKPPYVERRNICDKCSYFEICWV